MTSDERPWLASYPKDVPPEIDPSRYRSVAALLAECCERFRHRPAFFNMGRTLTYDDLDRKSAALANYLLNDLKLARGDRVAIMLPNVLQYPVAIMAVLRAGLTRRQHEPDVHGARAQAPADRFRRQRRSWCSRTSRTCSPMSSARRAASTSS